MGKYCKEVEVNLDGTDSNVFYLFGKVVSELMKHNVSKEKIDNFNKEVFSIKPDYDKVLRICKKWVKIKS